MFFLVMSSLNKKPKVSSSEVLHSLKLTVRPWNRPSQKETIVFQPFQVFAVLKWQGSSKPKGALNKKLGGYTSKLGLVYQWHSPRYLGIISDDVIGPPKTWVMMLWSIHGNYIYIIWRSLEWIIRIFQWILRSWSAHLSQHNVEPCQIMGTVLVILLAGGHSDRALTS